MSAQPNSSNGAAARAGAPATGAKEDAITQAMLDVLNWLGNHPELLNAIQAMDDAMNFGHGAGSAAAGPDAAAIREAQLLRDAEAARDALAADLKSKGGQLPATVTGGYDVKTGKVAAEACGGRECAENVVEKALGGDKGDARFTTALRPRTGNEVPICERCEANYGRDAFPPDAKFKSDQWAGGDMIDRPYPSDLDCIWIAVDRVGALAAFITGGSGPIPLNILNSDTWIMEDMERYILTFPKVSVAKFLVNVKYPESYLEMAERGVYVYDWLDVHRARSAARNLYDLVARPESPLKIEAMSEDISRFSSHLCFDGSFQNTTALDVRPLIPCRVPNSQ